MLLGDYMEEYGQVVATVGTAEKGYLDVRVAVESPGGHSSVPPSHTVRVFCLKYIKTCQT